MFFMDNIIEVSQNVQEHLSIGILIDPLLDRKQASSDLVETE